MAESDSCVTLSLISDPQDCSLGQLIWPLSERDRINGGGGTYFLPDEVSCNGSLVSVHTCFFYNDEGNTSNNNFRLRVGVFRQNVMGNRYIRRNVTNIDITRDNSSVTQNCTTMIIHCRSWKVTDLLCIYWMDAGVGYAHYSLI